MKGVVLKKLWCCVGGEVVYKNLVLSTEFRALALRQTFALTKD